MIDAGVALYAGAVPTVGSAAVGGRGIATLSGHLAPARFRPSQLAERVVVTPACGLAGATPGYARSALATCVEAARRLAEE
jgi:hypothetical protein